MNIFYTSQLLALILCVYQVQSIVTFSATFFSDYKGKGQRYDVNQQDCGNLRGTPVEEILSSVRVHSRCVALYDKWNCKGRKVEIAKNNPFQDDLRQLEFDNKAISFKQCDPPCAFPYPPKHEMKLRIFTNIDFKGKKQILDVDGCTLIPTGFIHSLKSAETNGTCFRLYTNSQCEEDHGWLELRPFTGPHNDITKWDSTLLEIRAVSHCAFQCTGTPEQNWMPKDRPPVRLGKQDMLLFDDKNYYGNAVQLTGINSCVDFTGNLVDWEAEVRSVQIGQGNCFHLYKRSGCQPENDRLEIRGDKVSFVNDGFDGQIRSLKPCHVVAPPPTKPTSKPGGTSTTKPGGIPTVRPGDVTTSNPNNPRKDSESGLSGKTWVGIIAGTIAFVVAGIALLCTFLIRNRRVRQAAEEKLDEKEIDEFFKGIGTDPSVYRGSGDNSCAEFIAETQPYDSKFEITKTSVAYDIKSVLGKGDFGNVYKGFSARAALSGLDTTAVAIKSGTSAQSLRALMKEVKVMQYVGNHDQIVQFVGCCSESIRQGEILVLVELCSKGPLDKFLQKNRQTFQNIVRRGKMDISKQDEYTGCNDKRVDEMKCPLDIFQLLRWCIEVAEGMNFLALKMVIHGDLASRNILLDDNYRAKISDYGLSKQLHSYTERVKKDREPHHWQWLALESLKTFQFSTKSDVWGFGVLCWEIFTLGDKPYPGVLWNDSFIEKLDNGMRLPMPKYAVTDCYNLMKTCWHEEPSCRPRFSEILTDMEKILNGLLPSEPSELHMPN